MELFEESDSFYLVLEYMSGGDLHGRITKKTYLSEKEARRYVIQVLKALKYMHDNYIVHRWVVPVWIHEYIHHSRNSFNILLTVKMYISFLPCWFY